MRGPILTPVITPVRRFVGVHAFGLALPMTAGLIAFGWRAAGLVALVLLGAAAGFAAWRTVGRRGRLLDPVHLGWQALLVAALLPAELASSHEWPAAAAAGLTLGPAAWLLGGTAGGRVLPALAVSLLAALALGGATTPEHVLSRDYAVTGDLLDAAPAQDPRPWLARDPPAGGREAVSRRPATRELTDFTARRRTGGSVVAVVRDRLPPMEDLVVIGHPRPVGMASLAAVLAGGAFLFYRGVADAKIGVLAVAAAYATLLLAPVPARVAAGGAAWTWGLGLPGNWPDAALPWMAPRPRVGWEAGLTFAHYELLAGPIVFAALFLAPLPSLRPLSGGWRVAYALLAGASMAAAGRYGDAQHGPLAALLAVGLLTPLADRLARAKTM